MAGKSILNPAQADLLNVEKTFFEDLQRAVEAFGADPSDRELLTKVAAGLSELFLLVVVGEFNSGKSAFINALVGDRVLAEGATPTTDQINVLHYGPQPASRRVERDVLEITYPAPFLQEISIVDTPGTNAVIERHQALTEEFVPRSDLVLFVTSAERPFTQSERQFLEKVKGWGKKIVVVINKIDLVNGPDDYHRIVQFVADGFRQLLSLEPPIFPVSGRVALQAKTEPQAGMLWQSSGFGPLEYYIFNTLDQASRVRLKLANPLSVADRLTSRYRSAIVERTGLLDQDARTVENIERQLEVYQADLQRDFEGRLARIDNLILELNERGDRFFDDTLRISRLLELRKTDRLKQDFEQRVVADTPHQIEQAVQEMVDWTVERESRIWRDVTDYLRERRQAGSDTDLIGRPDDAFEQFNYNRRMLLQQVSEKARVIMQSFDQRDEAEKLNQAVREAVARTTLTEIGAVGLGAGLLLLLSGAAADFTGILLALVVGGIGFYIIPARRRKAKYDFRHKLETLRGQLVGVLREQFQHELTLSTERVREAIGPYTRFIRTERQRLDGLARQFDDLTGRLNDLRRSIEEVTPGARLNEYTVPALPGLYAAPSQPTYPSLSALPANGSSRPAPALSPPPPPPSNYPHPADPEADGHLYPPSGFNY